MTSTGDTNMPLTLTPSKPTAKEQAMLAIEAASREARAHTPIVFVPEAMALQLSPATRVELLKAAIDRTMTGDRP